jgi:hypothetical protein
MMTPNDASSRRKTKMRHFLSQQAGSRFEIISPLPVLFANYISDFVVQAAPSKDFIS